MLLTIERKTLLGALDHVTAVVERRNTIPILANVLIEATSGAIVITATDLDIVVSEKVDALVSTKGKTTVLAHQMREIVKKLPDGAQVELSIQESGSRLRIKAGRAKFELATLPHEDFPSMNAGDMRNSFTMPASALKRLIARVKWCMSTEEARYYLNGFYLHAKDNMLFAAATDGHRLARYRTDLPEGADGMAGIIVPRRTSNELYRLLDGVEGDVSLSVSDSKISASFGNIEFMSKLIDGTFPPYDRVIPSVNDKTFEVGVREMASAVDRVSTISADRTRAVKVSLSAAGATLTVVNPEAGTSTDEVDGEYAGTPLEIGFNAKYMADILGQVDTPSARFLFSDAGTPAIVEQMGDDSTLYVIMPLRV